MKQIFIIRGNIRVYRRKGIPYLRIVTKLYGEETIDQFTFNEVLAFIALYNKTKTVKL